ncbi:MAG: hypothetical protein K2L96_04205 [Muribaculaceae bacterium]|nr:hypothetical protein [Muribaculaceae bacterium]
MENNNHTYSDELDQLRQQMEQLNAALETQKIINADLMDRVMRRDVSWFNKLLRYEIFLMLPLAIVLFLAIKFMFGTSWLFFAGTIAMFVLDVIWDSFIMPLPSTDFSTLSLLDLRRKVIRQMQQRKTQLFIELPVLVLWVIWFFYELVGTRVEVFRHMPPIVWLVTIMVSFGLGLLAVAFIYRELDRRSRRIIDQINTFVEGE